MKAWRILFRLALRRVLPWPLLLCSFLALLCVAKLSTPLPESVITEADSLGRMLARSRVWIATGFLVVLICVPRAAGAGASARTQEGDGLSCSPLSRWTEVSATWLGTVAGGVLLLIWGALCAEFAAAGNAPALSLALKYSNPSVRLVEDYGARWELPNSPKERSAIEAAAQDSRSRLVLEAVALPASGPSTFLRAHVAARQESGAEVGTLLSGRKRLSLTLGRGSPRSLVLQRDGRGAVAVIPAASLALYCPTPLGERSSSLRLLASGSLGLLAACGLALALGTYLQAWIAGFGTLACALAPALLGLWAWPGARIGALLQGYVPARPSVGEAVVLLIVSLLALAAATRARGRRKSI